MAACQNCLLTEVRKLVCGADSAGDQKHPSSSKKKNTKNPRSSNSQKIYSNKKNTKNPSSWNCKISLQTESSVLNNMLA